MKKLAIMTALLAGAGGPASATGDDYDGNHLLIACSAVERVTEGNMHQDWEEASGFYQCIAYVHGVMDTTELLTQAGGKTLPYCLPDFVTNGQLGRIVVKHLQENPSMLHFNGSVLVLAALNKAFPCPVKKTSQTQRF